MESGHFNLENGVHHGKGGHLFLVSGAHHVFDFATGKKRITSESLNTFSDNIVERRRAAIGLKSEYRHIIVPDKQSVLSDLLSIPISTRLGMEYREFMKCNDDIIYPIDILKELGERAFLRTDTHLTDLALIRLAGYIYENLTQKPSSDKVKEAEKTLTVKKEHCGDLGVKLNPNMSSEEVFCKANWSKHYSNNLVGNDGLIDIHINSSLTDAGRLVVFGDSFGRALGPHLSRYFSEVLFFRSRFVHGEILWLAQADYVISQNAERYLSDVKSDNDAPPFFLYPHLRPDVTDDGISRVLSALLSGCGLPKRRD